MAVTEVSETPPGVSGETLETLAARLDHMDCVLHEMKQVVDELAPAARAAAKLMDNPATRWRQRHGS
jgi:hypothetical protein